MPTIGALRWIFSDVTEPWSSAPPKFDTEPLARPGDTPVWSRWRRCRRAHRSPRCCRTRCWPFRPCPSRWRRRRSRDRRCRSPCSPRPRPGVGRAERDAVGGGVAHRVALDDEAGRRAGEQDAAGSARDRVVRHGDVGRRVGEAHVFDRDPRGRVGAERRVVNGVAADREPSLSPST